MNNEETIRDLLEKWAAAVRERDIDGILANHTQDFVMYDVPPPFESKGLDEYRKTWETFYSWAKDSKVFEIVDLTIHAGSEVAFAFSTMRCQGYKESGEADPLNFRLTFGLMKQEGQWLISHEHHSIPAE